MAYTGPSTGDDPAKIDLAGPSPRHARSRLQTYYATNPSLTLVHRAILVYILAFKNNTLVKT
jgi:hypothetical protein